MYLITPKRLQSYLIVLPDPCFPAEYYRNGSLFNPCAIGFLSERIDGSTCVPTGPFLHSYRCQCRSPFVWETRAHFELGRADPSVSSANATAAGGNWWSISANVFDGAEVMHAEGRRSLRVPFCRAPDCFSETNCNRLNTASCQVCLLT